VIEVAKRKKLGAKWMIVGEGGVAVIFEINRDFPYQVALSFDELAMEVLAWLDERSFEWDMYVDLPAKARQHLSGGSCMRRRGELFSAAIDQGWPHQVVLSARRCEGGGYNEIHEFCRDLTLCSRGHALYHDSEWFPRLLL
jgi:hypothetical protein